MRRAIENVGTFYQKGDYWECVPESFPEVLITLDTPWISQAQELRAQRVCASWERIVSLCMRFIEERRTATGLGARQFASPHVIIGANDWTVFFETESDVEVDVGVEFRDDVPFQLVIGD